MTLVRGSRLDELAPTLTSLPERLRLLVRVTDAVAFAHAHGIVHRDLTPSNIMIGPFGQVLVMDWGTAKVAPPTRVTRPTRVTPPTRVTRSTRVTRATARAPAQLPRLPRSLTLPGLATLLESIELKRAPASLSEPRVSWRRSRSGAMRRVPTRAPTSTRSARCSAGCSIRQTAARATHRGPLQRFAIARCDANRIALSDRRGLRSGAGTLSGRPARRSAPGNRARSAGAVRQNLSRRDPPGRRLSLHAYPVAAHRPDLTRPTSPT